MKVLTVVGARPQFVKAAVVSRALANIAGIGEVLVHTGQHYDPELSDIFFEELGIRRPDIQLGVGSGSHGAQTGRMLEKLEQVLIVEKPDWVLVYGDTNSTLAGALSAAKLNIPVAHVEAGLRSFNRQMPEETNRVLTDHVSSLLFTPTKAAVENLRREGIDDSNVVHVGDVMFDAALHYGQRSNDSGVSELTPFALATIHRAENTDDPERLLNIFAMLADLSGHLQVVIPLHPRTRARIEKYPEIKELLGQIRVVPPVGYFDMIAYERAASLILTDSGGVQKEAYFHGKPCVVFRDQSEWVELFESGQHVLLSPNSRKDLREVSQHLKASPTADQLKEAPYGNGKAGDLVAQSLFERFQFRRELDAQ